MKKIWIALFLALVTVTASASSTSLSCESRMYRHAWMRAWQNASGQGEIHLADSFPIGTKPFIEMLAQNHNLGSASMRSAGLQLDMQNLDCQMRDGVPLHCTLKHPQITAILMLEVFWNRNQENGRVVVNQPVQVQNLELIGRAGTGHDPLSYDVKLQADITLSGVTSTVAWDVLFVSSSLPTTWSHCHVTKH